MTNADALANLERLIQTQKSADAPWEPVTDYSFEARKAIEGRHPDLIVQAFQPREAYDIGCGPGHLVRLLADRGVYAQGFDKAEGFDIAVPKRPRFPKADLVICREVIEHLTVKEIAQAVRNLCALSSRYIYLTTRFAKNPDHFLSVDTSDDLDPTHISLLNQDFLRLLFVLEGFARRADLEAVLDWQHKGRVLVYERP